MDAGNMLKPMLARGELRMVGATTLDEYREHIEKDPALERRFQPVLVGEPSVEDTIGILRGLKERYEVHHGVRITDAALVARGDAVRPVHRRPVPAGQGDRPGRRGRLPAAHGDRLASGRGGRDRAGGAPAGDRGDGAGQGARPGLGRAAGAAAPGAGRPARDSWPRCPSGGATRRRTSRRSRPPRSSWRRCAARRTGPSATSTWAARPSCGTGGSRRCSRSWPTAEAELTVLQADGAMLKEEVGVDDIAAVVSVLDRHPGRPADGGRDGQAAADGGVAGLPRGRPGGGGRRGVRRGAPGPGRRRRPGPADRAASCSSARPASARPSWPRRWPSSCSTTSGRWYAST